MHIHLNNRQHCDEFIRLNEQWITAHFSLEDADRALAADPWRLVRDGGQLISITEADQVVGVCALVKESEACYQLARMAVDPNRRGKGLGDLLIETAIRRARETGAMRVYLLSNTALRPAISLYRKHGFQTLSEGPHPEYARCNIVMELRL